MPKVVYLFHLFSFVAVQCLQERLVVTDVGDNEVVLSFTFSQFLSAPVLEAEIVNYGTFPRLIGETIRSTKVDKFLLSMSRGHVDFGFCSLGDIRSSPSGVELSALFNKDWSDEGWHALSRILFQNLHLPVNLSELDRTTRPSLSDPESEARYIRFPSIYFGPDIHDRIFGLLPGGRSLGLGSLVPDICPGDTAMASVEMSLEAIRGKGGISGWGFTIYGTFLMRLDAKKTVEEISGKTLASIWTQIQESVLEIRIGTTVLQYSGKAVSDGIRKPLDFGHHVPDSLDSIVVDKYVTGTQRRGGMINVLMTNRDEYKSRDVYYLEVFPWEIIPYSHTFRIWSVSAETGEHKRTGCHWTNHTPWTTRGAMFEASLSIPPRTTLHISIRFDRNSPTGRNLPYDGLRGINIGSSLLLISNNQTIGVEFGDMWNVRKASRRLTPNLLFELAFPDQTMRGKIFVLASIPIVLVHNLIFSWTRRRIK